MLDLTSGRRKSSWRADGLTVWWLLWSADGKSLFGACFAGETSTRPFGRVWDSDTGRPTSPPMAGTSYAIYTPSGDRLLTVGDGLGHVRDAANGQIRGSRFPADFSIASLHPDGRRMLAPASDNTVRLWELSADAEPVSPGRDRGADIEDRDRTQSSETEPVSFSTGAAGGRADRPLAGPGCGRTRSGPVSESLNRPPLGCRRATLPRLVAPLQRLQSRRPQLRDRKPSGGPHAFRGAALGREDGPFAVSADAPHQLGRGAGVPSRWQGPGCGRLQRTGPVLGHLHRLRDRPAASSRRDRLESVLRPGRQDPRGGTRQRSHRQGRRPALGHNDMPTHRRITAQHYHGHANRIPAGWSSFARGHPGEGSRPFHPALGHGERAGDRQAVS